MSGLAQRAAIESAPEARNGPGRLVLVVGPSGAGKDTLIAGARAARGQDDTIVFPRRLITRPASPHEDSDQISEQAFAEATANGAFAFWWRAHGLGYGVPVAIEHHLGQSRTVVCNVSRTVVRALRERYAQVVVVLVTAPTEVLAQRLRLRSRDTDGPLEERLERSQMIENDLRPDFVIRNTGDPKSGTDRLLEAIHAPVRGMALLDRP